MGKRRKSRELTLQLLYMHEIRKESTGDVLRQFWAERETINPEIRSFVNAVFTGTLEHLEKIDEIISELSLNWKLYRLSLVDKNIIRFAIYEICFRDDIPVKVSIDEAIEVAKRFSSDDAGSFVNGILDTVIKKKEYYLERLSAPSP